MRLCVTEAAIDAMSLGALEGLRPDTLYLSTGGGWSPATTEMLFALATRPRAEIVAASDNNRQGDIFAARLKGLAVDAGAGFERPRPEREDWNEDLKQKAKKKMEERGDRENCRMPAVRLKGDAPPG